MVVPSSLCYYHRTFGKSERKCSPPCSSRETARPSPVINSVTGSHLLYAFDQLSGRRFLNRHRGRAEHLPRCHRNSYACHNQRHTSIKYNQHLSLPTALPFECMTTERITFTLGKRTYTWQFVNADVPRPILCADFLQAHTLLVDLHNRRLIDMQYLATTALHPSDQECIPTELHQHAKQQFHAHPAGLLGHHHGLDTPTTVQARCAPPHSHYRRPGACACTPFATRQTGSRQGRVPDHGRSRHCLPLSLAMVITLAFGSEKLGSPPTLRGLPPTERPDGARQISHSAHTRLHSTLGRMPDLLEGRPHMRLPLSSGCRGRHPENGGHHPFRPL